MSGDRNHAATTTGGTLLAMCDQLGLRLVTNFEPGLGRMAACADNFLRMKHLREIDPAGNYMMISWSPECTAFLESYDGIFEYSTHGPAAYFALRDVAVFRPDLTVDIGLDELKIGPPREGAYRTMGSGYLIPQIPWRTALASLKAYYSRCARSRDFAPWNRPLPIPDAMKDEFGLAQAKLALIHFSANGSPAVPKPATPETWLPAMSWLRSRDYRMVFVGQGDMPDLFHEFGVADYPRSPFNSIDNDLRLFRAADFALLCGDQIDGLAETLGVPAVHANSWWSAAVPRRSRCSVEIPALARDRSGKLLTWLELGRVFADRDLFADGFLPSAFEPRLASPEEILAATIEAVDLGAAWRDRSALQTLAHGCDPLDLKSQSESRVGQYFLEAHAGALALA